MSRKRIAARILRGLPPGFRFNKARIYKIPYQHFLLGISIDGTSYKQTWRMLTLLQPMFRTEPFLHIEYCRRLRNHDTPGPDPFTGGTSFFCGSDEAIADAALRAVRGAGLIEDIERGYTPAQFLQQHGKENLEDARAFQAFETACAAGLCGDLVRARRGLKAARETTIDQAARSRPFRDHDEFLRDTEIGLQMVDQGAAAFQAHMQREAQAAAAFYGFCPPTFDPDPAAS